MQLHAKPNVERDSLTKIFLLRLFVAPHQRTKRLKVLVIFS